MIRYILNDWVQTDSIPLDDSNVAAALARGVLHGQAAGPDTVTGALVSSGEDEVYVLGHRWDRVARWRVVGDPSTAAGWAPA